MAQVQEVLDAVRKLIADEVSMAVAGQRWSDEELTEWLTDAQREVVRLKPEAYMQTALFEVAVGSSRQRLDPAEAYRLVRVEANGSDE